MRAHKSEPKTVFVNTMLYVPADDVDRVRRFLDEGVEIEWAWDVEAALIARVEEIVATGAATLPPVAVTIDEKRRVLRFRPYSGTPDRPIH